MAANSRKKKTKYDYTIPVDHQITDTHKNRGISQLLRQLCRLSKQQVLGYLRQHSPLLCYLCVTVQNSLFYRKQQQQHSQQPTYWKCLLKTRSLTVWMLKLAALTFFICEDFAILIQGLSLKVESCSFLWKQDTPFCVAHGKLETSANRAIELLV